MKHRKDPLQVLTDEIDKSVKLIDGLMEEYKHLRRVEDTSFIELGKLLKHDDRFIS